MFSKFLSDLMDSSFILVSRILCISVIASLAPEGTIVAILIHWFIMTVWLSTSTQDNNFCDHNKLYDFIFYSIFGMVYIFTHVTLQDGKTLYKYLFFYSILFIENTIANVLWVLNSDQDVHQQSYYQPIVILNVVPFVLGIMCMVLYYKVFHPTTGYNFRQRVISCS